MIAQLSRNRGMRRLYDILFFSFISMFLAGIEQLFPRPVPYLKIGFAFVPVLLVVRRFRLWELYALIALKSIAIGVLFATIFTPPFVLGLAGGIAAVTVMKAASFAPRFVSLIGVSVLGSVASNTTQFIAAVYLFQLPRIPFLIPVLAAFSAGAGLLVGIIAFVVEREIERIEQDEPIQS